MELKPLIKETIRKHCSDKRVERVITDMLQETLQQQYLNRLDWDKHFNKRYKESILNHFGNDLGND